VGELSHYSAYGVSIVCELWLAPASQIFRSMTIVRLLILQRCIHFMSMPMQIYLSWGIISPALC